MDETGTQENPDRRRHEAINRMGIGFRMKPRAKA